MLIINNYKNCIFIKFNKFYKVNNNITINIPVCLSYIFQILNIGLCSPLKLRYNYEINLFI